MFWCTLDIEIHSMPPLQDSQPMAKATMTTSSSGGLRALPTIFSCPLHSFLESSLRLGTGQARQRWPPSLMPLKAMCWDPRPVLLGLSATSLSSLSLFDSALEKGIDAPPMAFHWQ
jgi:hypothetical protein